MCAWCNSKFKNKWYLPSINCKSKYSSIISSSLPQSISDLDTDKSDITDETIKQVTQSVNQMLLKTSIGNSTCNITPSSSPHDRTPDRQSIPNLNPNDIHTQTNTQPTHTYKAASPKNNITHPVTIFEQTEQIIMDIHVSLHSSTLHKIFYRNSTSVGHAIMTVHIRHTYSKFKQVI